MSETSDMTCEEFVEEWLAANYDKENRVPYLQLARKAEKDPRCRWAVHYLRIVIAKALQEQEEPSPEVLQAMKRDYSRIGGMPGLTQKDIALKYGITLQKFQKIRDQYNWTHASAPVTEKELEEKDMRELIDGLLHKEEQLFTENYIKRRQRELERNSRRWLDVKKGKIEPFIEVMKEMKVEGIPVPVDYKVFELPFKKTDSQAIMFHLSDLHISKLDISGAGVDKTLELFWQSVFRHVELVKRVTPEPDAVNIVVGNDWFHVDTPAGTTTRGTRQDVDGTVYDMVGIGYRVLVKVVETISQMFDYIPINLIVVSSNHDAMSGIHMGFAAQWIYEGNEQVNVLHSRHLRQYLRFGSNAIGLEHGHGVKLKDIPSQMAFECPFFSQCPNRYFVVGHLHHTKETRVGEVDDKGVHVLQGGSVSLTDKWHDDNGYNMARKVMNSYVFDAQLGNVARFKA